VSGTSASPCMSTPDGTIASEIVERLVTGLYQLVDGKLCVICVDERRRLGPAPSPIAKGDEERSQVSTTYGRHVIGRRMARRRTHGRYDPSRVR